MFSDFVFLLLSFSLSVSRFALYTIELCRHNTHTIYINIYIYRCLNKCCVPLQQYKKNICVYIIIYYLNVFSLAF